MANTDRPNGFKFAKSQLGAPSNAMMRFYEAGDRSADTTNNHGDIYLGDVVKLVSGKVLPFNSGDTALGVVAAIGKSGAVEHGETGYYNIDDLTLRYAPLSEATGYVIGVIPAEGNLFEAQTAADLDLVQGSLADVSVDATEAHGTRLTGQSTAELVTSVNGDVMVVENVTTPDNDITLTNARHLVRFTTTTNTL